MIFNLPGYQVIDAIDLPLGGRQVKLHGWRRVEPWMSTVVNADCGQVLGIVDSRDSAAIGGRWLAQPSLAEADRGGGDRPSAAFKKAIWIICASRSGTTATKGLLVKTNGTSSWLFGAKLDLGPDVELLEGAVGEPGLASHAVVKVWEGFEIGDRQIKLQGSVVAPGGSDVAPPGGAPPPSVPRVERPIRNRQNYRGGSCASSTAVRVRRVGRLMLLVG